MSQNPFFSHYIPFVQGLPARPKLLQRTFQKTIGTINFVKITKQSLYKANSFACSLANTDKPVAATLQRKYSGGIIFVVITKIITKLIVPRNYFVIVSARMVTYSPPPLPHFWPKGIFQRRGVGMYNLRPHAADILYTSPPLFCTPPPHP